MILDCISCYKDIAENDQDSVKLYNLMKNRVKRNFYEFISTKKLSFILNLLKQVFINNDVIY